MFQRERLQRSDNWTAQELAQELYAMFGPQIPLEHAAPITLYQQGTNPPFILRGFSDGDTVIQMRGRNGAVLGGISFPGGNFTFTPASGGGTGGSQQPQTATSTSGRTYPCTITGGSGTTYQADVYLAGVSSAPTNLTVTHRSIDSGETIPAGTKTFVVKSGAQYFLETPVWL